MKAMHPVLLSHRQMHLVASARPATADKMPAAARIALFYGAALLVMCAVMLVG
jgi:hypothetical protein